MFTINLLIIIILILSAFTFIYAIYKAVHLTKLKTPNKMPDLLRQFINLIGGVLATNLGAVLGITVEKTNNGEFQATKMLIFEGISTPTALQVGAAWLYFFVLIGAGIGYLKYVDQQKPGDAVPELRQLANTVIGVFVGIAVVYLS